MAPVGEYLWPWWGNTYGPGGGILMALPGGILMTLMGEYFWPLTKYSICVQSDAKCYSILLVLNGQISWIILNALCS